MAAIDKGEVIRNHLKAQADHTLVDATEAAKLLNREFGLRGTAKIDPQSIVAHKAILTRQINQDGGPEKQVLTREQKKLIDRLVKNGGSEQLEKEVKRWARLGAVADVAEYMAGIATLISSLDDSHRNTLAAIKEHTAK
jgi:hypothetical protein